MQLGLFDEPAWIPERVYETFAGSLAKQAPFNELPTLIRRFYEQTAKRWNSSDTSTPSQT